MNYRTKPNVKQAVQWTGFNHDEISLFTGRRYASTGSDIPQKLAIFTIEGVMQASPGDYIVRGIEGEYYPVKQKIFEASYEPIP